MIYKTTIVVWTNYDPQETPATSLVADSENSYISYRSTRIVNNPENDPHWDETSDFSVDTNTWKV